MTAFFCHEAVIAQCCATTCCPPGSHKEPWNLEPKGCFISIRPRPSISLHSSAETLPLCSCNTVFCGGVGKSPSLWCKEVSHLDSRGLIVLKLVGF